MFEPLTVLKILYIDVINHYLDMQEIVFKLAMEDDRMKKKVMRAVAEYGGMYLHYLHPPQHLLRISYMFCLLMQCMLCFSGLYYNGHEGGKDNYGGRSRSCASRNKNQEIGI